MCRRTCVSTPVLTRVRSYTYTFIRTPVLSPCSNEYLRMYVHIHMHSYVPLYYRHVSVSANPLTTRKWTFAFHNYSVSPKHFVTVSINATFLKHMLWTTHLAVNFCSDSSFAWLSVSSNQNLIRRTSQLRLLDSSLNWDSSLQLLLRLRCER